MKLGNAFSAWQTIFRGIPRQSILGLLSFNSFMNDLHSVNLSDETQNFYVGDTYTVTEEEVTNLTWILVGY